SAWAPSRSWRTPISASWAMRPAGRAAGRLVDGRLAGRRDGAGDRDQRITGLVLVDAVGVQVEGEPIRDFFALDARGVAEYSYHDPDRFYVDPATVPAEQAALRRANLATMRIMAGPSMHDPDLLGR